MSFFPDNPGNDEVKEEEIGRYLTEGTQSDWERVGPPVRTIILGINKTHLFPNAYYAYFLLALGGKQHTDHFGRMGTSLKPPYVGVNYPYSIAHPDSSSFVDTRTSSLVFSHDPSSSSSRGFPYGVGGNTALASQQDFGIPGVFPSSYTTALGGGAGGRGDLGVAAAGGRSVEEEHHDTREGDVLAAAAAAAAAAVQSSRPARERSRIPRPSEAETNIPPTTNPNREPQIPVSILPNPAGVQQLEHDRRQNAAESERRRQRTRAAARRRKDPQTEEENAFVEELREQQNLSWKEIREMFKQRFNKDAPESRLQMRMTRRRKLRESRWDEDDVSTCFGGFYLGFSFVHMLIKRCEFLFFFSWALRFIYYYKLVIIWNKISIKLLLNW